MNFEIQFNIKKIIAQKSLKKTKFERKTKLKITVTVLKK